MFGNDASLSGDPFEHFGEGGRFDLLAEDVGGGIVEVEEDGALVELVDEEVVSVGQGDVWTVTETVSESYRRRERA